jgi:hypothetical protein
VLTGHIAVDGDGFCEYEAVVHEHRDLEPSAAPEAEDLQML